MIQAGALDIAYFEAGPADGPPVFLDVLDDIHTYVEVVPALVAQGCHVYMPYLRRLWAYPFSANEATPRSGEQAALADLLALMDALKVPRAVLAGYDWGGRAACVVAALWPQRCAGLVSFNSYNIQNIARAMEPDLPDNEHSLWYQYYFHSERGRNGLAKYRRAVCRLLWSCGRPPGSLTTKRLNAVPPRLTTRTLCTWTDPTAIALAWCRVTRPMPR